MPSCAVCRKNNSGKTLTVRRVPGTALELCEVCWESWVSPKVRAKPYTWEPWPMHLARHPSEGAADLCDPETW